MKAEERHELKENDLAGWLQFGLWAFLKQNGSYVLLVLALCFLGYQLWSLYERKQYDQRVNAWAELAMAERTDPTNAAAAWLNVVDKYPIKAVQAEAYLDLGNFYSRMILERPLMDAKKISREEALDKALGYYHNALETLGSDTLIAAKAHLGLAAVLEDQGEWDKAKAEYEILAAANGPYSATPFKDLAAARLKTLDDRRDAPRLASMMPPPPPPAGLKPDTNAPLPGLPGLLDQPLPGIMQQSGGPILPPISVKPSATFPSLEPIGPFVVPPMATTAPAPDAVPATTQK